MTDHISQPEPGRFEYEALDPATQSIRLLTLFVDNEGDKIRCELNTHLWDQDSGFVSRQGFDSAKGGSVEGHSDQSLSVKSSIQEQVNNPSGGDASMEYAAISYVWGNPTDSREILLNGRRFKLPTENLWLTLRNLQRFCRQNSHASIVVWTDAICIDQKNQHEKDLQIEKMYLVYHLASVVIVWLGVSSKESDRAFEFIDRIEKVVRTETGTKDEEPGATLADSILLSSTKQLISSDHVEGWLALHNLLDRDWWTRSWTLQEVVMGRVVVVLCGDRLASWPAIHLAIRVALLTSQDVQHLHSIEAQKAAHDPSRMLGEWPRYSSILPNGACTMRKFKHLLDEGSIPHSRILPQFLRATRSRVPQHMQDKVYAILGFLPPEMREIIGKPNYGIGVEPIYIQLVEAYVYGTQSLDIICFSDHTDTQNPRLPSWTPDWMWIERFTPFQGLFEQETSVYDWHCKAIQLYMPSFSEDRITLEVSGVVIGTIERVGMESEIVPRLRKKTTAINDGKRMEYLVTEWIRDDWLQELNTEAREVPRDPQMNLHEDAAHTILGAFHLRYTNSPETAHAPFPSTPDHQEAMERPSNQQDLGNMHRAITTITNCRTVARTSNDEFCLVPFWTAPGDIVCQFVGCTMPVILRPHEKGSFRYVGECYVYGKPAGEMMRVLKGAMESEAGLVSFGLV